MEMYLPTPLTVYESLRAQGHPILDNAQQPISYHPWGVFDHTVSSVSYNNL